MNSCLSVYLLSKSLHFVYSICMSDDVTNLYFSGDRGKPAYCDKPFDDCSVLCHCLVIIQAVCVSNWKSFSNS